jgi:hypothetical protein
VAPAGPSASLSFFAMMIASAAPTASAGFNQAADHLELREQSRRAVPLVQLFDPTAKSYSAVLASGGALTVASLFRAPNSPRTTT